MPPKKEVTAYIARTKRASRFSAETAGDAVKNLLPMLEAAMEEAAQLERSLHEANLVEPNPRHEEAFQKIGAIRRITGEMSVQARQLMQVMRELEQVNEAIAASSTA